MKLLIVDDESHVREGMLSMIDWEAAHVDQIVTAKNGRQGLEVALTFEPNIVLTDVRMPKMDGIEMAFAVREAYPDCSIIFMSGYSDKEYLKSAIQLSAISYVEKPIELEELFLAVTEAVKVQEQLILQNKRKEEINGRLEISMEALKYPSDISGIAKERGCFKNSAIYRGSDSLCRRQNQHVWDEGH